MGWRAELGFAGAAPLFRAWRSKVAADNLTVAAPGAWVCRAQPQLVDRFGGVLPYVGYDAATQLFLLEGEQHGTLEGVGYTLELAPQTGVSEELANAMTSLLTNALPAGSGIQVTLFGSPRIDHALHSYVDSVVPPDQADDPERADTLAWLARSRAAMLRRGAIAELYPHSNARTRHFRAWLSVVIPLGRGGLEQATRTALAARQAQIGTLRSQYLYSHTWAVEDLLYTCWGLLNPHRWMRGDSPALSYDDGRELRYQLLASDTAIEVCEDCLRVSALEADEGLEVVGLSLRAFPPTLSMAQMFRVIGSETGTVNTYPCPFMVTTGVVLPDYDKERSRTMVMAANAERVAAQPMARYVPSYAAVRDDWKIAQMAFDEGQMTVRMFAQTLLFCPLGKRHEYEEAVRAIWREANLEIGNDRLMHVQALLASLPMTLGPALASDLRLCGRDSTKTVWNAAQMLPVAAEWSGTGPREGPSGTRAYPQLLLVGRRGQVMPVDLFANRSGNYNALVCGTSGSGKSVLLNELVCRTLAMGGLVFVIDSGYSYEKLCSLLGGQFIDIRRDEPICLNPFEITQDLESGIPMLIPLLEQMTAYTGRLSEYEVAQLQMHVADVWLTAKLAGRRPTMTELAESLKHNCYLGGSTPSRTDSQYRDELAAMSEEERAKRCDPRIRDLGVRLSPFTADGVYGRYFESDAPRIDFKAPLVVLELNNLSGQRHLQSVVLLMLLYQVLATVFSPARRAVQKLIVIDEAWQLLSAGEGFGGAAQFIEYAYRTSRKWNAAIVTATQSVMDYERSSAARAAFDNSDQLFLLRQKPESVEALASSGKLVVDEYQRATLRSLTTVHGAFSEVFVRCGEQPPAVGRLFLDPFSALLYSSRAADVEAINALRRQGLGVREAVLRLLRQEGSQ